MTESKEELIIQYNNWIKSLYASMHLCSFRKILAEIEHKKKKYIKIPQVHWKYKVVQMKSIFHIIEKKMKKYYSFLSEENNGQNNLIQFWFNQVVIILDELQSKVERDIINLNKSINLDMEIIIRQIQYIYKGYIELLYLLIKYSYIRKNYHEIFAYLSIVNRLGNYIYYIINVYSMPILQKIYLIRAKIHLANCDYINAYQYLKKTIDMCFKQLNYMINRGLNLENIDKNNNNPIANEESLSKIKIKILQTILINIILDLYLRGVLFEDLGDTAEAVDSYKQSKYFSSKFFQDKYYSNFTEFFFVLQNNGYKYLAVMEELKKFKKEHENNVRLFEYQKLRKNILKKIKYQENYNKYYSRFTVEQKDNLYKGKLKQFLDNVGKKAYKEEKNRQGILSKFNKSQYITSTTTLLNTYLSKDFTSRLKKLKTIKISEYPKEVNNFINDNSYYKNKNTNNIKKIKRSIIENRNKNEELNVNNSSLRNNNTIRILDKSKSTSNKNKNNFNFEQSNNQTFSKNYLEKNNSFHDLKNGKYLTKNSSHIYSLFHDKNNYSSINAFQSVNTGSIIINLKSSQSVNNIFYRREGNFSHTYHHLNQKSDFRNIKTKEINKNITPLNKSLLTTHDLNGKKLFKIKIKVNNKRENNNNDKNYFDKTLFKKKKYIDQFYFEEMKFHKQLLKNKSSENESYKEEYFDFDSKKAEMEADIAYNRILALCKSSIQKKNFDNFFNEVKLFQASTTRDNNKIKFKTKTSPKNNLENDKNDNLNNKEKDTGIQKNNI